MSWTYTNYRWEPINVRKGDRYNYKRDAVATWGRKEEQVVATVTYHDNAKSRYWGKWHVNVKGLSPGLNELRNSDIPQFSRKDDAIAWVTAMVRLSI
jgi:hypothetical protein